MSAKVKPTQFWDQERIKMLLDADDTAVCRALVVIYNNQTADEQEMGGTKYNNGRGFNGVDAPLMSKFAEWYLQKKYLSPKMLAITRKKLKRYTNQLVEAANAKAAREQQQKGVTA